MADKKISALTAASTPLAGTEVLPIVQSGSTVKVSISDVTAGRAVVASSYQVGTRLKISATHIADAAAPTGNNTGLAFSSRIYPCDSAGNLTNNTLSLGSSLYQFSSIHTGDNVVIGTANKGIDFSANTNLPGMTSELLNAYEEGTWTPNQGSGLTVGGAFSSNGRYTRVGRLVTVSGTVIGATSIAVSAIGQICDNLPFTKAGASVSTGTAFSSSLTTSGVAAAGGAILYSLTALSGGTQILFALTYEVA